MLTRVYRQITTVDSDAQVTIATSKKQVSAIKNQLGDKVNICMEPDRRDTFPAICLAATYLHDVQGVSEEEAVVVCPVDPYVEESYFEALKELAKMADKVSRVSTFKEKPDAKTAQGYIEAGALWNGGVFAFRLGYLLQRAHELITFQNYDDLFEHYSDQKKISFDYAVVEHEKDIQVLRYHGEWKDLGSWNTFTEAMTTNVVGRAEMDDTCVNTNVVNELNLPMLCMGCRNLVIAASPDGILIADKEQSSYMKPYVEKIEQQVMYAEKSWGSFNVLDVQDNSMTIKIILLPGHMLHYHSHEHRDEVWTVTNGHGRVVVDDVERNVAAGDVISLPIGCKHTVIADGKLEIIEVQLGNEISVEDKQKFEWK